MIQYKTNIIDILKKAGFSSYKIRQEKLLGQATLQKLRQNELVSWENINTICSLLDCQPGDILEYIPNNTDTKRTL
jgi:putative transcriptional regulator